MASISFRAEFDPKYGEAVEVAKSVQRITCRNASPFTFHGTNTYIVGDKEVAIIDPGPEGYDGHLEAILNAARGRTVSHIVVTHTHIDHSPLCQALAAETGAPVYGEGIHRAARELHLGEINALDESGDHAFQPDFVVKHGDIIEGKEFALEAVFTPGHTANHMAFGLVGTEQLFSGDHVMAWATSIVAPPDGNMADYMRSLDTLLQRDETMYFPGHGGRLNKAKEFVRALRTHRKMRETAVLQRIQKGDETIRQIVAVIYKDTDKRLHGAAALSVFAHIEDLLRKNLIRCEGTATLDSRYHVVG